MSDIMSISRHRMGTDGCGVTTLVGFHGCPLNCKYCINRSCHDDSIARATYTPRELIDTVSIDAPYFLMTGGGITFGAGEPLLQAPFIHEVCSLADSRWTKTIETSLYADWSKISILLPDIDFWYIDIKAVDPKIYRRYTGKQNVRVLANLRRLVNQVGVDKICVRYPIIPGYSTEQNRQDGIHTLRNEINKDLLIEEFDYIKC